MQPLNQPVISKQMKTAEFQLQGVGDPRLAVHATSALPAWLWSIDGTRILWANPVGANLFGAANGAVLARKTFGPADPQRRQVAQLAGRLPGGGAVRLERLRGFGAPIGRLMTCGCARLDFADGSHGILIAAAEPVGRAMPLLERLQRLVEGIDTPIAAFARDGMFVGGSDAARSLLGFRNLSEAGLDEARNDALKQGRVETPIGIGHMVLQRVGSGADVGLVALIAPAATVAPAAATQPGSEEGQSVLPGEAPPAFALVDEFASEPPQQPAEMAAIEPASQLVAPSGEQPMPGYEQPALSGEAPAEFALIDEFADEPEAAVEPAALEPPSEPEPRMPEVEPSPVEQPAEIATTALLHQHEPSADVAAIADEPAAPPTLEPAPANETPVAPPVAAEPIHVPSWLDEPSPNTRRVPLRFMWQMDAEGRFSLGTDEFTRLIGARTAAGFGRLWSEIAEAFGLDPDGRVVKAVATRNTWSGITLNWPVDGGGRLPVELSGLPVYDRARNFAGYRGFGVCRDLDGLARLDALRRYEFFSHPPAPQPLSADIVQPDPAPPAPAQESPAQDLLPKTCLPKTCPPPNHQQNLTLHRPVSMNRLRLMPSRLHNKPIWKPPWKRPRTSCRFGSSASRRRLL